MADRLNDRQLIRFFFSRPASWESRMAINLPLVEKLLPQRPPEPFHFSIGLRMVRAADRVFDLVVAQTGPELVVPSPADELTPAVGQDSLRERVVAARFFFSRSMAFPSVWR